MAGFVQNLLKDAAGATFGSDYLRDYTHASKTFRTNNYQYAPKLKFLFHVYFEINPEAYAENLSTGANFGLAVKSVKLPSYSFAVQTMNQYNRKRLVQTKINYDQVDITFHDDSGDQIRSLWYAYYTYYYGDGQNPQVAFGGKRGNNALKTNVGGGVAAAANGADYNLRTQYDNEATTNQYWGYQGTTADPEGRKIPFFKNIQVFGFDQHRYYAYTLINPMITSFSHDTYDYSQGNGTMQMQMGLQYETVVYNKGSIDGTDPSNIVAGFGDREHYDRTLSPIAKPGSNATILGQGGLVDAAGGVVNSLSKNPPDILGAIVTAGTAYNTFKNKNLKQVAKQELLTGLQNSVRDTPNTRNAIFNFPGPAGTSQSIGRALNNYIQSPPTIGAPGKAGVATNNG